MHTARRNLLGNEALYLRLLAKFHDLLTTDQPLPADLGKLVVFSGVRAFPSRVKCATLAWHTLREALRSAGETVPAK